MTQHPSDPTGDELAAQYAASNAARPRQLKQEWTYMNVIPNGSFTDDISGWEADSNTTAARVILNSEAVCRLTAKAAGDVSIATPTGLYACWAIPGKRHYFTARKQDAAVARSWTLTVRWYTAAGALISSVDLDVNAVSVGQWGQVGSVAVAPSNAARLVLVATINGCATGEVHYLDKLGVFTGNGEDQDNPYPGTFTYYDRETPGRWRVGFGISVSATLGTIIERWGAPETDPGV